MSLRVYCLLLMNLAVNISAKSVYSYGSQYGREPQNLAESTPPTSEPLPKKVSCSSVKSQGPCLEMVSKGGSNDPSFQAASYGATSIEVASEESRQDFMQLRDAVSLNSSPSGRGSNLDQNLQPVVTNKNSEYDPRTPRIVSYGPMYRLLKPHGAQSSSRTAPSASYKPPVVISMTSMSVPNGQNGYKAGFSQKDAYNSVAATYFSRNKPSISSMVITSGPIITFIMPNQSDHQLVQAINRTQSSHEPDAPIKSLVTVDQPETSKPFEHGQGMNHQRPTSQLHMPNEGRYWSPQTVRKLVNAPKTHLVSKNLSNPQSRTTEFTQLEKVYSSPDKIYKPSNVFKAAHTTYLQQISKPVQSSQQLADFSQGVLYGSSPMAVPLSGSVYRFTRPGSIRGTSGSTGTSMYVPSSSAKTVQSNYIPHFYQPGLSFPKVGYGSPSSAVASGETRYDFTQSGNAYGSADNAYTSHSQPTSSSSNLFQNSYFLARQGRTQPNYNVFPTMSMQMPSKSLDTPFSQKDSVQDLEHLNQMRNRLSNVHAENQEGFQTWHHYSSVLASDPFQNDDQGKRLPKPIQSRPWKPKNLFDYLSSLPLSAEKSLSSNYNQLQTGQSESVKLTSHNSLYKRQILFPLQSGQGSFSNTRKK